MSIRLHITGAPGVGKTTVGSALARQLAIPHIDADEFAWELTEMPYQKRLEPHCRREILREKIRENESWVLTGSIYGWGSEFYAQCRLVVLMITPTKIRLKRLKDRERNKFGSRIEVGGDMYSVYIDFVKKAVLYDHGNDKVRSLARDINWMKSLQGESLWIDGRYSLETIIENLVLIVSDAAKIQSR